MDLGIKGKCAIVTGGSRGIGRAIAIALAREGCCVAICARGSEDLKRTVAEIRSGHGECTGIAADVNVADDIDRVFSEAVKAFGSVHVLVNNAGGGGRWGKAIVEDTEEQVWEEVYSKNAMAAVRFTMRALPYMKRQRWGRVVAIASILGKEGGGRPWFAMAKSAEISLMKTLAMNPELARQNITFNSVAPGAIMIPATGWDAMCKEKPEDFARFVDALPLGRLGTPDEVASVVSFVCSEQARLVNGACIAVDGGESKSF